MKYPIEIALNEFGMGSIKVGGVTIPHTTVVSFRGKAGEIPVVTVNMLALHGLTVSAEAETIINRCDPTAEAVK